MPVRVRYSIKLSISSTTAEEKDLGNLAFEIVSDALGEGGTRKFTIPVGAVDVPVALGNVTSASLLLLRSIAKDPTCTVGALKFRRNTVVNPQEDLVPLGTQKEAHAIITTTGLTGLFVSNAGSTEAELTVGVAGD